MQLGDCLNNYTICCFKLIGCEKKHQQRGDQGDEYCDREGAQPVQWEQGLARAHRWRRHALSVSQVRWLWLYMLMLFDKDNVFSQLLYIMPIIARRTWTSMCVRVLFAVKLCFQIFRCGHGCFALGWFYRVRHELLQSEHRPHAIAFDTAGWGTNTLSSFRS